MAATAKILIVDDEESIRGFLTDLLEGEGYCCVSAASGAEALDQLRADFFNLVFTDIRMPGMSGIDLLLEIKRKWPKTEVIIMTSYASAEGDLKAVQDGAYDYLKKPFDNLEGILSLAKKVIGRQLLSNDLEQLLRDIRQKR